MRDRHDYARSSARWFAKRHKRTWTDEEKEAAIGWFMREAGAVQCQCTRWWPEAALDDEARHRGVTIVRRGDAQLDMCPRCALYAQLLGVLASRTQGLQLRLF